MLADGVAGLGAAIDGVAADGVVAPVWPLSDADLVSSLVSVWAAQQRLTAVAARLVREAQVRGVPAAAGCTSVAVWLRDVLRVSPSTGRRLAELGQVVGRRPGLAVALAAGVVTVDQVEVIDAALTAVADAAADPGAGPASADDAAADLARSPAAGPAAGPAAAVVVAGVGAGAVARAGQVLLAAAGRLDPHALRLCAGRILHHLDSDGDHRHAAAEQRRQDREARRARAGRALYLTPVGAGRVRLSGWLDAEAAAIITAALDPLSRPLGSHAAGGHAGGGSAGGGSAGGGSAGGGPAGDDRSPAQRRADALTEVCDLALRAGALPDHGGDRPGIVVTVPFDVITGELGAGLLDTGQPIPAGQVRRLACDAQLIPAVLGSRGEPLDLGRARRLFTGAARRALILRDRGCAFPTCDRPHRWCDAHHIRPWTHGGGTDINNGVLLCRHHHRLIHDHPSQRGPWHVTIAPDGIPEFTPPAHLDPHQRPRRNPYHLRT